MNQPHGSPSAADHLKGVRQHSRAQHLDKNIWDAFPSRLRILRTGKGLSMAELGRQAGVSTSLVCAVEHGRWLPSLDSAAAIAVALELTLGQLVGLEELPEGVLADMQRAV